MLNFGRVFRGEKITSLARRGFSNWFRDHEKTSQSENLGANSERERERELAVSDVFVALVVKLLQNQGLFLVKTRIPKDVRNLNI